MQKIARINKGIITENRQYSYAKIRFTENGNKKSSPIRELQTMFRSYQNSTVISRKNHIQAQGYKGFESNRNITEKSVEIATALETSIKGFAMTI